MRPLALPVAALVSFALPAQETPARTFRQWIGGLEVGGASREARTVGGLREVRAREWSMIARLGQEIRQEVEQTARRAADGGLTFTWRIQLSQEPFEGRAEWTPAEPGVLKLHPRNGAALTKEVPPGALLWPEELDARLMEAARLRRPVTATTFSFPAQQWTVLTLTPVAQDPLPGHPDAVRFQGEEAEGTARIPVEIWISPTGGELRHRLELGSMVFLMQRSDLPPPTSGSAAGFFESTLQRFPPTPFQPWLRELTLRAEGSQPDLPQDAQQARLPGGRWRLRAAAPPTPAEATQPVAQPGEEARYLAPSPLVPFRDPAFEGLLRRLALPPGLSRWEIAKRVTTFVFEWITDKDFTVGFASALEACRSPRGDCTEHGVLAVALLRRLGVPARGATGWVGLEGTLGLHFWVEVKLQDRWVPVDPTFDEAPASTFRIKLGDTDLSDLGSVGWEGAAMAFSGVRWLPEREGDRPWGAGVRLAGDEITVPDGTRLRWPGGRWALSDGYLTLGSWTVTATARPAGAELKGARHLAGARTLRSGWWAADSKRLWMDLGRGRWLRIEGVSEASAFALLDQLIASAGSP